MHGTSSPPCCLPTPRVSIAAPLLPLVGMPAHRFLLSTCSVVVFQFLFCLVGTVVETVFVCLFVCLFVCGGGSG
jgi:hypothetical protein